MPSIWRCSHRAWMRRRSLIRFFQPIPSMTAMMNCLAWRTSAISSISRTASVSLEPVESKPLAATALPGRISRTSGGQTIKKA
jgi:hypothetical protein